MLARATSVIGRFCFIDTGINRSPRRATRRYLSIYLSRVSLDSRPRTASLHTDISSPRGITSNFAPCNVKFNNTRNGPTKLRNYIQKVRRNNFVENSTRKSLPRVFDRPHFIFSLSLFFFYTPSPPPKLRYSCMFN